MKVIDRKIKMFRAHYDPGIGPTARNAFMITDPNSPIEEATMQEHGIYVKCKPTKDSKDGSFNEHFLPFAVIQTIHLLPEEKTKKEKI